MNELEVVQIKDRPTRLEDSLFSKELAPHYMKLAGQLASSEMVPKCYRNKPSDLFLCWSLGYQLGLTPEQAMNCISVVNGRAVMWGDEMLALCMIHPEFIDINEEPIMGSAGNIIGFTCTVNRRNRTKTVSVFTLDMAKKAGLLAKGGVWIQYPERMLKLRARGYCLRDAFPDALKGIKPREEVEDYIDGEYVTHENKNSRTEQLKQELSNAVINQGQNIAVENQEIGQETASEDESLYEDQIGEKKIDVHSQVRELLEEKHVTEERLDKALKYYEVHKLEELSDEAAQDFINQLIKH